MQIEKRPLASLVPYARNSRTHSEAQITQIVASIKEFGWTNPILIDGENGIIAGHGRLKAAQLLGMAEVPVIELAGLSETQKRAYIIADNKLAENAGWESDLLALEISALKLEAFNLDILGFDGDELKALANRGNPGLTDPDEAPEIPAQPISTRGDIWRLGGHRIMCGDSTDADSLAQLMIGEHAVLMNTDPPYGVSYGDVANSRNRARNKRNGGDGRNYKDRLWNDIANEDLNGLQLQAFLETIIRTALPHLISNPAFYLWHPMLTQGTFFAAADILIHRQIIWVKPSLIMGRGDYHWRHELCFYGWIRDKHCAWLRGRDQDTVWEVGREYDKIHPTQKPIALFEQPLENHVRPGELCYEPFSGSGSQIIAAEKTGRRCYAMELDPAYVDVAVVRWQNFTGEQATHDATSDTFMNISEQRNHARQKTDTYPSQTS